MLIKGRTCRRWLCLSSRDDGLGSRHHLAVGADLGGRGLAARCAGVEDGPVFLRHGGRSGLLLALLLEEPPVECLFRAGRLGFQTIQDFLVLEHLGALGHRAFLDDVIDAVQHRIGREFSFREPVEGFHLLGKTFHRGWQ